MWISVFDKFPYVLCHLNFCLQGYSPGFGRAIFCNTCFIDGRHLEMCAVTMELVIPLPRVLVSEKVDKVRGFISEGGHKACTTNHASCIHVE